MVNSTLGPQVTLKRRTVSCLSNNWTWQCGTNSSCHCPPWWERIGEEVLFLAGPTPLILVCIVNPLRPLSAAADKARVQNCLPAEVEDLHLMLLMVSQIQVTLMLLLIPLVEHRMRLNQIQIYHLDRCSPTTETRKVTSYSLQRISPF